MGVSSKEEWRSRLARKESLLPDDLSQDSVVFFGQDKGPFYGDELDAMWVAMKYGLKTVNGYSGLYPPDYALKYGSDCAEMPRRILSYLRFTGQGNNLDDYRGLVKHITPIGFSDCEGHWFTEPPVITISEREYTIDEIRNLCLEFSEKRHMNNRDIVDIKIINSGDIAISANSGVGKPIRLSWRFLDSNGNAITAWDDTRKDLPFDIPANGDIVVSIPLNSSMKKKGATLQVSLVQEGVFWAHDIGVEPLIIAWGK
jgi:hypothetical protein